MDSLTVITEDEATASQVADQRVATPGPWQVINGFVYAPWSRIAPFTDGDGVHHADYRSGLVALVYGHVATQWDPASVDADRDANAYLIAAAPDLLQVARVEHELQMRGFTLATARRLGPDAETAYLRGGAPGLNNWRRRLREAAIAKAAVPPTTNGAQHMKDETRDESTGLGEPARRTEGSDIEPTPQGDGHPGDAPSQGDPGDETPVAEQTAPGEPPQA